MTTDLSKLLKWLGIDSEDLGINVTGMCMDSRKVKPGNVFIALSGNDNHGIDFAYQVQRSGACAILAESVSEDKAKPKARQQPLSIPVVEIEKLSTKLGDLSAKFYNYPSRRLKVFGVTGTNGKTSCTWLLLQAWNKLGIKAGYIGTLGYGTIKQIHDLDNTTPPALGLQKIFAEFLDNGVTHVALEVSSHGLSLGRTSSTEFSGVAFTNISRDHLDFHKTIEEYAAVKKCLFSDYNADFAVINASDYYGKQWLKEINLPVTSYSSINQADLFATDVELLPQGIKFKVNYHNHSYKVTTGLLGHFNVDNLLLVVGILLQQGFTIKDILSVVSELNPVPGRMNRVDSKEIGPLILVDYAHTPDALEQVLKALKQHNARKIWCVFGCGGNRDKGKRPQMGYIAETLADRVIITDDNPRYEDNQQIATDILMGMHSKPKVIHSRKDAIVYAIENAHSKDLVLIAGKGHETYQIIDGNKYPFDDRAIAREILGNLGRVA